jgi:hypothetical protein
VRGGLVVTKSASPVDDSSSSSSAISQAFKPALVSRHRAPLLLISFSSLRLWLGSSRAHRVHDDGAVEYAGQNQ